MMCQFCKQDVDQPCENAQDVHQRAMNHVERCENAFRENLSDRINPSDGQSAGSI
jgi:hypothetical protein